MVYGYYGRSVEVLVYDDDMMYRVLMIIRLQYKWIL